MSDPADTNGEKTRGRPFQPGQVANPAGRPKGSRNKLGEAFISALHDDFVEHGSAAIRQVREERPQDYVKVCASILPKELNVSTSEELTDEQARSRLAELMAVLGAALSGSEYAPENGASPAVRPADGFH